MRSGLGAGVSELTLSLIVSGVQGMLTFQALALFVYALGRDILLAVGAAALIFFTRSAEYGTVYPLFLLGTEHTYGVVGLSTGVLAVAMLGAGWYRAGALLLGMAPCIHPSLGSWTALVVFLAVLSDFRSLRVELRAALPWLLAGCGVTVASLVVHFSLAPGTAAGMARLSPEDLSTFVRLWDGHRAAVNIWHNGVMLNVASFVVASTWLTFFSTDIPSSSKLLLRITAAGSLLALAMIPLSWIPPDRLPAALLVLMPGRYLNFAAMTFVALIFGLLASGRQLWSSVVLLFLTFGVCSATRACCGSFSNTITVFAIKVTSGRSISSGWQRPHCSPAPHGRAESKGRTSERAVAPIAPTAHVPALPRRVDDDASARRAVGRAFQ